MRKLLCMIGIHFYTNWTKESCSFTSKQEGFFKSTEREGTGYLCYGTCDCCGKLKRVLVK